MGRYRKPAAPMSNYITEEGEKVLVEELRYLWKEERPLVTQQVSDAAALGDRSENAEYIYGKKRLREIDRRVRYLTKRLETVTVVDFFPDNREKVYFGAYITLENVTPENMNQENDTPSNSTPKKQQPAVQHFRLVGPDEIDPGKGYISIDSPLGKALLSQEIDSEVEISSPNGIRCWLILGIEYR